MSKNVSYDSADCKPLTLNSQLTFDFYDDDEDQEDNVASNNSEQIFELLDKNVDKKQIAQFVDQLSSEEAKSSLYNLNEALVRIEVHQRDGYYDTLYAEILNYTVNQLEQKCNISGECNTNTHD